jgi:hypothetical protein
MLLNCNVVHYFTRQNTTQENVNSTLKDAVTDARNIKTSGQGKTLKRVQIQTYNICNRSIKPTHGEIMVTSLLFYHVI